MVCPGIGSTVRDAVYAGRALDALRQQVRRANADDNLTYVAVRVDSFRKLLGEAQKVNNISVQV